MTTILKPKQAVRTELSGVPCVVETYLGGGGQGEVYRARLGNSVLALKWYFRHAATREQYSALQSLISKGAPSELFLWPMDLAADDGVGGFGYLMPLRPPGFKSFNDLAKRTIEPTFVALATAGVNLAHGFLQLHARGLAYRDISFGNVFLDPKTGAVLICDNDNVGVDGRHHSGVAGTPRFMAPEIVRSQAMPSTQTDQFSLAVLLFYMFMMHHPLEGKKEYGIHCMDLPAMVRIYGTEPVFILDPKDDSNRPVRGHHDNVLAFWPIYPIFLRRLFTRAFTQGLHDPNARIKESEWRQALVQLRDCVIYCGSCGVENFYNLGATAGSIGPSPCWSCKRPVPAPLALQLGKHLVMLNQQTRLYGHHINGLSSYDFSRPMAEVSRNPTNPDLWGLKNLGGTNWIATNASGQVNEVAPGRSVLMALGTRVKFGNVEGVFISPGKRS